MQLRGDYNSTSAVNSAVAKTIVTITAPPVAAASASSLHLGVGNRPSSVSTLTIASVPPSISGAGGSVSAANTPLAPSLKGFTTGPSNSSGHHVSFMPMTGMPMPGMTGLKRLRSSNSSLGSPTGIVGIGVGADTTSAPSLIDASEEQVPRNHHRLLEQCQSVQSQITTLGDVEDDDEEQVSDSGSESIGLALVETVPQLESQPMEGTSSSSSSVK
ncbi:hypothetical protein KR009_006237 [Drosophila setifemur]|nr:hypothetical protein KR009_006237 [Drosophila setifemur]